MAKKRKFTNEILVGAAILIAIAVAIYGYVFLREIPVRQHGFHVYMVFSDITGLEKGDAVTVSGLKVGRVQEMKLTKGFVKVKAWLNGSIPFPRDSRAAIRSIGMIGEKYIDLEPGHSTEMLSEGDVIQGRYISDIADMGGPVSKMITQLNSLLTKFNTAMDSAFGAQTQRHFAETLEHTRNISYQMQLSLQKNLDHFQNVLTSFDTLSTSLKNYWQNNQKAIGQTTENVSTMAMQLRHTLTKIDSMLNVTQTLLADVESQRGTAGKVLRNDELYQKLNDTIEQAQTILDDVKKNPAKYLQISVIRLF